MGSWTAGTLASNATVEDITINGTDVWIVDAKSDKVFRYNGAASRLSGSQNATSSFSLNSGNTNPKGIVTDGTYLWVVNDSTTDKVFKYTVAGQLVGSWTIDSAQPDADGHHDRSDQREPGHLDRRQRHRQGVPVRQRTQPDLGQPRRPRPPSPWPPATPTRKASPIRRHPQRV